MINNIKSTKIRAEFDTTFLNNKIKPDGGVLFLRKQETLYIKKFYLLLKLSVKVQMIYEKKKGKINKLQEMPLKDWVKI